MSILSNEDENNTSVEILAKMKGKDLIYLSAVAFSILEDLEKEWAVNLDLKKKLFHNPNMQNLLYLKDRWREKFLEAS